MAKIIEIEGIGDVASAKLIEAGIKTVEALREAAKTKKGRKALAEKTGLPEKNILTWVNRADLMRLRGVSTQYSELLEAAGVDTIVELSKRIAANLHKKMTEVNAEKKLVRQLPTAKAVEGWVEQAKKLDRIVEY
jgi:predicted flap endonuclease-1-like 5' DNA nuclease